MVTYCIQTIVCFAFIVSERAGSYTLEEDVKLIRAVRRHTNRRGGQLNANIYVFLLVVNICKVLVVHRNKESSEIV